MSRTAARRSTTRWFIKPETVLKTAGGSITTLVGYRNTPLFRLDEVKVSDTLTVDCRRAAAASMCWKAQGP